VQRHVARKRRTGERDQRRKRRDDDPLPQ